MNEDLLRGALAKIAHPNGEGDIVSAGIVDEIEIEGGEITVVLKLGGFDRDARHELEDSVRSALGAVEGVEEVLLEVEVDDHFREETLVRLLDVVVGC